MSTNIGHFEILGELSKSTTGAVYKANDPQAGQTVALKAIKLSAFGESAAQLEKCLIQEAEATKVLSHPNLPPVYGAGKIDRQFCVAMEYIQGNSIATILARKEGFSIWDLLDIARQVCSGLDHARSHNVFHHSLEPAKIMCGWDGTVRILGYGVSSVGRFTARMPGVPSILHYMSPEQIRGENIDTRSNLFSFGCMFYEMVTDSKAFPGDDAESVRQSILNKAPVPPIELNPKLQPALGNLIMKTLANDPKARYQSARALLDDLEQCKESKSQVAEKKAAAKKVTEPASSVVIPEAVKAATQAKFIASAPPAACKPESVVSAVPPAKVKPAMASPAASRPAPVAALPGLSSNKPVEKKSTVPPVRSNAAAASAGGRPASMAQNSPTLPTLRASVKSPVEARSASSPSLSSVLEQVSAQVAQPVKPRIAVDPIMAEDGFAQNGRVSFSQMTELPPLQEIYSEPAPLAPVCDQDPADVPTSTMYDGAPEKPKASAQEVAQKAIKEIRSIPPRLVVYSIAGAAILILIIALALVLHVNNLDNDGDSPRHSAVQSAAPTRKQIAVQSQPVQIQPGQIQPEPSAATQTGVQPSPQVVETRPGASRSTVGAKGKNARKKISAPIAPTIVPGQMSIDSTPQGAQVQIDGKTDPSWITPFTLPGLAVGSHSVTVSKPGFSSDTRTVDVTSGGKSFVMTQLTQLLATLSVSTSPAGASVYVDGKDVGKVTPAQLSLDKGQHVVLVRKPGFLDETTNAQFNLGQTASFSPTLRPLGNVDDIKTVGKMKKLFGGKEAQGMGTISIKTQPKGAQVAVNQHMLDKNSPVDFTLDPGNYIVDITLTSYLPIHKVVTVDKGGKVVIDEVLQHD